MHRLVVVSLLLVALVLSGQVTAQALPSGTSINSSSNGDAYRVAGSRTEGPAGRQATSSRLLPSAVDRYRYAFVVACPGNTPAFPGNVLCDNATRSCVAPQILHWTYRAVAGVEPPAWQSTGTQCIGVAQAQAAAAFPGFSLADFRRLPLPAGRAVLQPGNGYAVIDVPTGVQADAAQVVLQTQVVGVPVQVRATPVAFTWDFGDGSVLGPTADPGAPWPDLRLAHAYEAGGSFAVTLTTAYSGEYSVAGGGWLPVEGTAEVVGAPVPVVVLTGGSALVADAVGAPTG